MHLIDVCHNRITLIFFIMKLKISILFICVFILCTAMCCREEEGDPPIAVDLVDEFAVRGRFINTLGVSLGISF
jgi:hypothetical protein